MTYDFQPPQHKKKNLFPQVLILIVVIMLVSLGVTVLAWFSLLQPVSSAISPQQFVIAPGTSTSKIASNLADQGLIKSAVVFKILVYRENLTQKLQAGGYTLSPSMSTSEIAYTLTEAESEQVWVKILEGWRREEIANALATSLTAHNYTFDPDEFLSQTESKEGYLFPDSYLVSPKDTEASIAKRMEETLSTKLTEQVRADIERQSKTIHQILTMASLIEREANDDQGRKMVSGILWKRIDNEWPLQVDATLQYVKGYDQQRDTWWPTALSADKEIESPYNTYKYTGLPPGPIAAPSLASIVAAVYPTQSDYWFYITGKDGKMYYGQTLDEHQANINNYLR